MQEYPITSFKTLLLNIQVDQGQSQITTLCGVNLAGEGPIKTQGSMVVNTGSGRYESTDWNCAGATADEGQVILRQTAANGTLEICSTWDTDKITGVVRRRDVLSNTGSSPITLHRCLARIALPSGRYEIYSQQSRWCNENQGAWKDLHAGEITLCCVSGRTTQGGTPYACIRDVETHEGLAIHILPRGNWVMRFSAIPNADSLPYVVVELGLSDENLRCLLQPGESLDLPELLFQELPDGEPHLAAPALHEFLLTHYFSGAKPSAPVVYNTWFDQFEILDVPRLRRQLAAARTAGCEVFVIDAGWYGAGGPNWWAQAGDWREKTEAAFFGKMSEFAAEVRSAGLGFGIWMEPERVGPEAPIRSAHPDWFVPVGTGSAQTAAARFNLANPAAYLWLRQEISRLVETYTLAWMKLDFNFDMDYDASGQELSSYTALWYQMLDEIRAAHPGTFFEGCASGAMRLDINSLSHVDGNFPSDSVESVDLLRISQGAYLRLPPGRLTRWAVLRSLNPALPRYQLRPEDSPATILVPGGALWEPAETVDLDFALLAAMPGMLGFSGDLAGLPPAALARVGEHVAFFKEWRHFITRSVVHLLTPPQPITDRQGWAAFQFQDPADSTSLLFVYRLGVAPQKAAPQKAAPQKAASQAAHLRLRGLKPEGSYVVQRVLTVGGLPPPPVILPGLDWMTTGLSVDLPAVGGSRTCAAAVYSIKPG